MRYGGHIENEAAYGDAIKRRMIRNSVVGKLQRLAEEQPMMLRLIEEVIEPARVRMNERHNLERQRQAEKGGWDFEPYLYRPLFELDNVQATASWVVSLAWDSVDSFSFPEQLVLRHLKTKKGLSEKQAAWVTKMVEEEPVREAKLQERKAARAAADAASNHIGAIKDRLKDMELTVEFSKRLEGGDYGPKMIVKLRDANSNLFVTFGTSEWLWGTEKGQQYLVTGTVKAHDRYEGAAQTILTRTKGIPYQELSA